MPGRRPSSTTRLGDSVLRGNGSCQRIKQGPLTATLSWRPGPTWTAKVDHLPTAANKKGEALGKRVALFAIKLKRNP